MENQKIWIKFFLPNHLYNQLKKFKKKINPEIKDLSDDNNIQNAPNIIKLSYEELFKNKKGEIINIDVRGDKYEDNSIYFKVKNISKEFGIPNLQKSIISSECNYDNTIHYKYFMCFETRNKKTFIFETLFLTLCGFRKMIEVTRNVFTNNTKYILHKWLDQFDDAKIKTFTFDKSLNEKSKIGYVYCTTSPTINHIKIGFWRGSIESLQSRYVTYYGSDLELFHVMTKDAPKLEYLCHAHFNEQRITNELFLKDNLDEYKLYLENNKEECEHNEEYYAVKMNDISIEYNDYSVQYDVTTVYLFELGLVKDLRKTMNINNSYANNSCVCVYGITTDIEEKINEIIKSHEQINKPKLKFVSHIDAQNTLEGKQIIEDYVDVLNLCFNDDIIILPQKLIYQTKEKYDYISDKCRGRMSQIITKLKDKENEIMMLQKDVTMEQKNVEAEKQNTMLAEKEIQILQMQLEMQMIKNK